MIDTSRWTPYTSQQHGFTLRHPPGWTVTPAERDWTLEADAESMVSAGFDGFLSSAQDLWVTVWSASAEDMPETTEGLMSWVEGYCQLNDPPCQVSSDSTVRLCHERFDCHPGVLVPIDGQQFRAFFTGGDYQGRVIGVAVWRPEWDVTVEPYGGARRLLEAFLSTMDVCPAQPDQTPSGCPAESG